MSAAMLTGKSQAAAGDTICSAFARTVMARADEVALRRYGSGDELTWRQYGEDACRVAAGLRSLGLERRARVALLMRNRPEFHVIDMGVLLAGGTPMSIYNSSAPEQIRFLLRHSRAQITVVEDAGFLERLLEVRDDLPDLERIITVEEVDSADCSTYGDLLVADPVDLEVGTKSVAVDDLLTLIYTSGTTGPPKGVMLTHGNLRSAVKMYVEVLGRPMAGLRTISYLPMAHIAERVATHYFHICEGTVVTTCGDLTRLPDALTEVRPQWFFCAPRLWEKFQASIQSMLVADADLRVAFDAARSLGRKIFACRNERQPLPEALAADWDDARRRVVEPVLARLGLDQVEIANSGSAPMPLETALLFLDLGLPLSDCYGQSEVSGAATWDPHHIVPGTSGKPLPGMELRLAEDGEVLLRGPTVFPGYLDDPERTADALDEKGWLHTGDLGKLDDEGNLQIVDRKKELIITAGGKNVSPAQLETALKESPLIAQACAIGDGRPSIAALIVLDPEVAPAWARSQGIDDALLPALAAHPTVQAEVARAVERANQRFSHAEQVRTFKVLGDVWLPDSDVLTPTAKLKRREVLARYAADVDALYQ